MASAPLVIGTRESKLAMWQALHTQQLLKARGVDSTVQGMSTKGDRIQDIPLSAFSEKGVFTKELDVALLKGAIDCAVHCVKDLPTTLPKGLAIGCFLPRGVKHDCLLVNKESAVFSTRSIPQTLSGLLQFGLTIGTSSLRRVAFVSAMQQSTDSGEASVGRRTSLTSIRGNLNTRLRKLKEGLFDAVMLARIGVNRLGWNQTSFGEDNHIGIADASVSTVPYAVGQGALAVVIRDSGSEQMAEMFKAMECAKALLTCTTERALLRVLEGGCKVPVAVRCNLFVKCALCDFCTRVQAPHCCRACHRPLAAGKLFLNLTAFVATANGATVLQSTAKTLIPERWLSQIHGESQPNAKDRNDMVLFAQSLGKRVAESLVCKGAAEIIADIRKSIES